MTMDVTAVICYQLGTAKMLDVCLASLVRHTPASLLRVLLVYRDEGLAFDADGCVAQAREHFEVELRPVAFRGPDSGSRVHGRLLDAVASTVLTPYVLTLDSDCFPVADDWLEGLLGLLDDTTKVVGILHPWAPPPPWIAEKSMELRIRSQHCWWNTHVACQLLERAWLTELAVPYNGGDDTGLLVPLETRHREKLVKGYRPTLCPRPDGDFDAEFNRDVCVVYGDAVYHHGGYSRKTVHGDRDVMKEPFDWARERLFEECGAEFLLEPDNCYRYVFDREESVAADKMERIFGLGPR